jgi:intergrase/recombinase
MKTKVELLEEIVRKQDELIRSFGNCNCDICEKANSELASLKSQLAEEKEEDVYTKSLRLLTEFMDKTPSEEIAVELRKIANKAGEEKEGRKCAGCGTPLNDYCNRCQHLWES